MLLLLLPLLLFPLHDRLDLADLLRFRLCCPPQYFLLGIFQQLHVHARGCGELRSRSISILLQHFS
jgi:hypothetical protein